MPLPSAPPRSSPFRPRLRALSVVTHALVPGVVSGEAGAASGPVDDRALQRRLE